MITLILGVFHHFCKSARSASWQRENFMESLHSDDSATYLLIIWVKKYTFSKEIETKTISLDCFSKYTCKRRRIGFNFFHLGMCILRRLTDQLCSCISAFSTLHRFEPPRGKTYNVVSEQVRHKPTCTSTEKS